MFLPLKSARRFSYSEATSMRRHPCQLNTLWIARKRAGLGQKTVAHRLGHKTASTISEYETGRLLPGLRTGLKLFVVRISETSLARGPSYGLSFSSTLGFWFQRPRL